MLKVTTTPADAQQSAWDIAIDAIQTELDTAKSEEATYQRALAKATARVGELKIALKLIRNIAERPESSLVLSARDILHEGGRS